VPVAVEMLGALGEEAAAFISDLGRRIAATTGEPRSSAFLFERLTVSALQSSEATPLPSLELRRCRLDWMTFLYSLTLTLKS